MLGAAGALEAIVCVQSIQSGKLHPTLNLVHPDVENGCDLDYIPGQARDKDVRIAMSNSFGFGGHNACIMLRRYEPKSEPASVPA